MSRQYEDLMAALGEAGSLCGGMVIGRIEVNGRLTNVELGVINNQTGSFNLTPAGAKYLDSLPKVAAPAPKRPGITKVAPPKVKAKEVPAIEPEETTGTADYNLPDFD